jgi:predicted AAA+ superfamily ATPase
VGKTTLARQVMEALPFPSHYATADEPTLKDRAWLEAQWETARFLARARRRTTLLVLDEVQKIPAWSETVKRLWDEDSGAARPIQVLLLGSAPLAMQSGLTESLAGRFEIVPVPHWFFSEMREAFRWDLDRFVYFGAYPGAAPLIRNRERWARYIKDSLIETTISRDVLLLHRVEKPALLRQLFFLACEYSGRILSYNKMLGQLQDAGNTTTLAHYLTLLAGAGMVAGIPKFTPSGVREKASSPKLSVLNTALVSALGTRGLGDARQDREHWGRLVESAVGAYLLNGAMASGIEVLYWRERGFEVDFVLRREKRVVAIEVKSGRRRDSLPGLAAFATAFKPSRILLVGGDGIPLEEFLTTPVERFLGK